MRRLWATGSAIVMCLALGVLPALAQEDAVADWATTADVAPFHAVAEGSVVVWGTASCEVSLSGGVSTDGAEGWFVLCTYDMSDPRVSGTDRQDRFHLLAGRVGAGAVWVGEEALLTNDAGTWRGSIQAAGDAGEAHYVGEGAYEGLEFHYYFFAQDVSESVLHGWISPISAPPAEEATAAETIGEPADSGARIIEIEELDERTVDLTIDSPAVGTEKVRLLLPAGFDPEADTDWPVLYLLHGAGNDYTSWTLETDVEELTAELPLLVVMPEAGWDGWYADWWNGGEGGPPMWETFHTSEVRELLERNWHAGDERAVAGLSMGGLGAMAYAARHPELFEAAASFSGMLHPTALDPTTVGFDVPPSLWGDRTEQADVWAAHDPVELAPNLANTALYVSFGSGEPGPLDDADAAYDELEAAFAEMNESFVARLAELGIPVTVDAHGPGTHTMPYVERGLHEAMPLLLEAMGM